MPKYKLYIIASAFLLICTMKHEVTHAQKSGSAISYFSIETRITNILQGGIEIGVFYNFNDNYSVGLQFANQNVDGTAKRLLFNSSDHSGLDIRLSWLTAIKTRYHFTNPHSGIFLELSGGIEEFRIQSGVEKDENINAFLMLSTGYNWTPFEDYGLRVTPNFGMIYAFSRASEKEINNISYRLRPFFPSPALSLGWNF